MNFLDRALPLWERETATPIFESALSRGLSIIPIPPGEKGTKLLNWPEKAVNSAEIMNGLDGWNYGVGANDTFCILDIDDPEAFRKEITVPLPATYTVKSRRGAHCYFRHSNLSKHLGNRSGGIFDFQSSYKYVVGEGSVHPSGHVYACIDPSEIVTIPDDLVAALDHYISERKARRKAGGLKAGDREDMLNYAGSIFTQEMKDSDDREKMLAMLHARNETESEVLLSDGDLRRMVQSAFKDWEPSETGPEVILSKAPANVPTVEVAEIAEVKPHLAPSRRDYLDEVAEELTQGTKLPFNFARENLKMLVLAALPKFGRPALPWFPKLHTREYLVLISESPGAGKGETFRRVQQTAARSEQEGRPWDLEFVDGNTLGSPQWACVVFGGERSKDPIKVRKPGIVVDIGPNGRIVHYDEGRKLMQQDATGKTERGLLTMFTSLFESNTHAMGSFAHGSAAVSDANVSLSMHFTRAGFDSVFTGSGATSGGFLSRCVLVVEDGQPIKGDWRKVSSERVKELIGYILDCRARKVLLQEEGVDAIRQKVMDEIAQADPLHAARLPFLFAQDLYARGMFSKEGVITVGAAWRAGDWVRHQMQLRHTIWYERMGLALRKAFLKSPNRQRTLKQMKDAAHVYRAGSGGIGVFNATVKQLLTAGEIKAIAKTHAGTPIYGWEGED